MSKNPILSFVIPVFKKSPETFEKCLAHLQDMSLKEIEIIAVFDGPDPVLEEVAGRFKVKKLVIEHGGAPKARNAGREISIGKYISFFDADCFAVPEMAKRWVEEFERTGADFVYSGYKFTNEQGAYDSEQFDPYSLQCGNFIASMFPILREKCPKWDESLKAAQDWDFWLTAVENGCKGSFIQGYGFETEPLTAGSISYSGWSPENREETIRIVREKHGIYQRQVGISASVYSMKALHIAKMMKADLIKDTGVSNKNYKLILSLGYGPQTRFPGASPECVKIQFWMPWDIDCLYAISYKTARETIRLANEEITHNYCNDVISKKRLADLGIDAEVVPLPTDIDDLETILPEDFKVLIDADKAYMPILKDLPKAVPHIKMDFLSSTADIKEYSLLISFYEHPTVDEGMRRFLLNGRHLITNVQSPYCGYIDTNVSHPTFKNDIISRILDARALPFNEKAQGYYKQLVDPTKFCEKVKGYMPPIPLEMLEMQEEVV